MTFAKTVRPDRLASSRGPLAGVLLAASLGISAPALASDRWEEAGSGAVAILPVPVKATAITGGSLVCAEQRWSFRLRTDDRVASSGFVQAKLTVDEESFPVMAEQRPGLITVPIDFAMIEGLKSGAGLAISFGSGPDSPAATFALRDSRKVLEAVAPRCSQVDMSAFEQVSLSETDPAVERARPLLAEETKLFREATSATPKLAATHLDRGGGREMLFATLCGSSWYYGRTGCSLFGYIRPTPADEWRQAYNSEGMGLYIDPKISNGGWPDLVTLERGGVVQIHWKWNGSQYELRDPMVAGDEPTSTGAVTP
ncbi:hypothetical protein [Mesorhizobium sp. IMUNJ 23232]|uniref:hypothetical protein n=1 Tax=Mesorhizobium sp. IMUNJ 23232 TaxID=3376064 RepID=UPI0037A471B8